MPAEPTDSTDVTADGMAELGYDDLLALADELPQLCWVARPDGAIVWYNRRWREYTGHGLSQMRGQGWQAVHDPAHLERVVAGLRHSFATGEEWEDCFPLRRHDGQWRWFLSRARPSRDAQGRILRWIGTNTDITETVERDGRLRAEERRYRSLVDAVAAIVWRASVDGELADTSTAWSEFTGQQQASFASAGWLDAIHPDDRAATADAWTRAVARSEIYEVEHRVRRHDGVWRDMSARAAPVRDDSGAIVEWIGIHTDITHLKQVERDLAAAKDAAEQANLAKSQFIANMSHELRTPLSAVIGYAEMLEEEVEDAGQAHLLPDLRKINDAARHLLGLISDVLDLSKIEANRMTVFAEAFEVADMLAQVEATVQGLMGKHGNRLVVSAADAPGRMHTDQVKLRQCLFNLLGNAAKFTEHGTVELSARRIAEAGGDAIVFSVRDTGIGMTQEQCERLFQRFVQADASTTRRFGGTGLGLAITRGFAELMGGGIEVHSEAGVGTTFTLTIPARLPEAGAAPMALAEGEALPAGLADGSETVLVIDDDAATRELICRFLEREGFSVRQAGDGRIGLALARALRPRVVLLDVMMPQMDGWSVLSAIRADAELAETPVVMISFVREQGLALSLGADDYLIKPVEWRELAEAMKPYRAGQAGDVLVVDDDESSRRWLLSTLSREGIAARSAADGVEALAAIADTAPALVLLDLVMPRMDGLEFLHRLRAQPVHDTVRVIVLTAKDITPGEHASLDGKVDGVLSKGAVSLAEIAGQVRRYHTRTHHLRANDSPKTGTGPGRMPRGER